MAGIRYLDLIADTEALANVTGQRALFRRLVNNAVAHIASRWNWPYLWTGSFFTTDDDYSTGTVDVTIGSTAVTGNSTVWTAAMVGRKIRVASQRAYYTIASRTSNTAITLDQPYQGATATAQTYSLYQDEYLLRSDVDYPKLLRQIETGVPLLSLDISEFDLRYPAPETLGDPVIQTLIGRNVGTYTTGTITISSGSRIMTGVSTAWTTARGLSRGTKIQVGSVVFTVNTITNDTSLTVYESAAATIAEGTSYTAIIDNLIVQVLDLPDAARNIYYRFQRLPAVLDIDADMPDLPDSIHPLILDRVLIYSWVHKGFEDRAEAAESRFEHNLAQAILKYGSATPDRRQQRASSDRLYPMFKQPNIINN